MRTYILTVEDNPRNPFLLEECLRLGLHASLFKGIDGRRLNNVELTKIYDDDRAKALYGRGLSSAEIGCAASHLAIYKSVIESKETWSLVLEDDAALTDEISRVIAHLPILPPGKNIVNLRQFDRGPAYFRKRREHAMSPFMKTLNAPYGTTAYLISQQAAREVISAYRAKKIDSVADWPIRILPKVDFWICTLECVVTAETFSTIHQSREKMKVSASYNSKGNVKFKVLSKSRYIDFVIHISKMINSRIELEVILYHYVLPKFWRLLYKFKILAKL